MIYDMNDVAPPAVGETIPDGTYAKISMLIRKGGVDGPSDLDKGVLKPSNQPGSDVLSLDVEFTVLEGPYARRKVWQLFTVSGGKVDEHGKSIGWRISMETFRAMLDSAQGLSPNDNSEAAKAKRMLRGLSELSGMTFVGKIKIEPSNDPRYPDRNRLERAVLPTEPEWQKVMNGELVPPAPIVRPRAMPKPQVVPAWSEGSTPVAAAAPGSAAPAAKPAPAWLKG